MKLADSRKKYKAPPRTAMEVFEMLPEGTLAEVINNIIYMSPAPSFQHQTVLTNLVAELNTFIRKNKLGNCVAAPVDVYFDDKNALQPDIVFIKNANLSIVKEGKIKGSPDLIVEVLSPDKKYDIEYKKGVYEKFAVKEYFIVDPANKEVISYLHDGKKFVKQESKKGKIKSLLLKKSFSF
jgi:Uma2 family endonuclease